MGLKSLTKQLKLTYPTAMTALWVGRTTYLSMKRHSGGAGELLI